MSRSHNFSPGPAVLPEAVLRQTQEALWELNGCGQGLLETSHRGAAFADVMERATGRLRRLLRLSDDQEVLFLHGGARTQFYQIPMNLLRGGRATYLETGTWSRQAAEEARRYGTVDVGFSSADSRYDRVPEQGAWGPLPKGTTYLHYTSNNTVAGTEYAYVPDVEGASLMCDMSSNLLSRQVDGSRFDLLYAGAQKNLGPAGVTMVVLRKGLLERCDTNLPMMCRYDVHVKKGSMYNTPCTFGIYVIERVCAWLEELGGLDVIDARNQAQADLIYGVMDASDFWQGRAAKRSRSRMNATFSTGDAALDTACVAAATAEGLLGLKGHSSMGGLRASMYNAQNDEAVQALASFMKHFEATHG
jgi:phosphoserine aminotransferase